MPRLTELEVRMALAQIGNGETRACEVLVRGAHSKRKIWRMMLAGDLTVVATKRHIYNIRRRDHYVSKP